MKCFCVGTELLLIHFHSYLHYKRASFFTFPYWFISTVSTCFDWDHGLLFYL